MVDCSRDQSHVCINYDILYEQVYGLELNRHKRASCFSDRKDLISYLTETFDGCDRHVLSSLLVFLREFIRICKSTNWVSESRSSRGTAIGSCLLLVWVSEWITEYATWNYYTNPSRFTTRMHSTSEEIGSNLRQGNFEQDAST